MKITVTFLGRAGDIVGDANRIIVLELPEGATLRDLFLAIRDKVSRRLGEGILEGRLIFSIWVDGMETADFGQKLREGSRVTITTPEMGG